MSLSNQLLNVPLKLNFFFGNIAFITLFIAVLFYWFDFLDSRPISKKLKIICMLGANVSLAFLLILRWFESGHFPLSNLYESLIGLSWGFTSIHLILVLNPIELFSRIATKKVQFNWLKHQKFHGFVQTQKTNETNKPFSLTDTSKNKEQKLKQLSSQFSPKTKDIIGAITAPTALLTSVFATFFLPPEITRASALIPALKSNWLTMHVTVMVASYAFLLIGSLLSITYCVYRFSQLANQKKEYYLQPNARIISNSTGANLNQLNSQNTFFSSTANIEHTAFFNNTKNSLNSSLTNKTLESFNKKNDDFVLASTNKNNLNFATWLNNTSYRILGLGFPLLTIGILSGAVWANEAWGSYWSWDPKETWALITWLVFAVYFHSRYTRSSQSFIPAVIASVGFIVIWICYLGVNLLGTGLHSYGWFSS